MLRGETKALDFIDEEFKNPMTAAFMCSPDGQSFLPTFVQIF